MQEHKKDERFAMLFRKYLENSCTREEFDELFSSIRSRDIDPVFDQTVDLAFNNYRPRKSREPGYKILMKVAAAILIITIAGTAWFMTDSPGNHENVFVAAEQGGTVKKATQRSEYKYLLLPDSTQVWLNAASTIEFPAEFSKERREVYLKGEAYFDVKHADKIPFIIYTGDVITEVLGTAFNIKAYPGLEKITVSVKRGKVKVKYADREVALLTKGEQVSIGNRDKQVKEKKIKEEETTAWHDGNQVYDDYAIADIVADLERIYDVKINIEDTAVGQLRITTSFKREHGVENALMILGKLTGTTLKLENGIYNIKNN